jgi:high affinity sulfate transporter 1
MKRLFFPSFQNYKPAWIRSDVMAALVVTAIAIPESLGFAIIVGLPVQTGLYCALLAPVIFALFTSSRRLVVGADSATAALVASGAATIAVSGTPEYANAIALLGILTGLALTAMSAARFGFLANLISRPVLIGFISGVGVQLIIGKLPEMLGLSAHGSIFDKLFFLLTHLTQVELITAILSLGVVGIVIAGWKLHWPGALIALIVSILATKFLNLPHLGVGVIGIVPSGLPPVHFPQITLTMIISLIPAAGSIALVILAQSLAVIRNSAARHEEKVKDNRDLMALGFANITSAVIGGFAINGSPPRTSAGEMAGGKSQLVNICMSVMIGLVLVFATGLFVYVPTAALAAIVFTIGIHLVKFAELKQIWQMRRSECIIALVALGGVAVLGVQEGVMIAVILSLVERLRRQYHPLDEVLLRDQVYATWALDRFGKRKNQMDAPAGLLVYRFNDAIFFENAAYFYKRAVRALKKAKQPVTYFVLDASAISDVDYTAAKEIERFATLLNADDIEFGIAHVSPHIKYLLKRYRLIDLLGTNHVFPSLRYAIAAYSGDHSTSQERIQSLRLSPKNYVVIGGAVLELLGLRSTQNVDLVVNQRVYAKLRLRNWKEYIQDDGKKILSKSGYKVMLTWMGRDLQQLQKSSIIVDSIPVMGLADLIACKAQLGRKKDMKDVASIYAFLALEKAPTNLRLSGQLAPAYAKK